MSSPPLVSPPVTRHVGLAGLGLATLLPMLTGSMASLVLPALGQAFAVPFSTLQWVLVAYLLGLTCTTVVAGRLGDRLGLRRLLLWGTGGFALASLLCALAPAIGWLIAARALQGVSAACMLTLSLAMVGQLVPPARRGWSMGLLGTLSACGTALGPSFGGLLVAGFGWQASFLLLLPLTLLALGCVWGGLPPEDARPAEGIHLRGLPMLVTALLGYGLALTWGGLAGVWLGLAALLVAALFVRGERRVDSPLLPPAQPGNPGLRGGLVASALVASVMVATLLIGPFYLHGVFALDMGTVGLMISGGPLLAALTGMPAGWLVDRVGATRVVRLGLGLMLVAATCLALLGTGFGPLGYLLPILLLTAGYALFQTANNSAVVGGAKAGDRGAVAGLLTLSRNLGQLTGAAGLGGLFVTLVGRQDLATAMADELVFGTRGTFALTGLLLAAALWLAGGWGTPMQGERKGEVEGTDTKTPPQGEAS